MDYKKKTKKKKAALSISRLQGYLYPDSHIYRYYPGDSLFSCPSRQKLNAHLTGDALRGRHWEIQPHLPPMDPTLSFQLPGRGGGGEATSWLSGLVVQVPKLFFWHSPSHSCTPAALDWKILNSASFSISRRALLLIPLFIYSINIFWVPTMFYFKHQIYTTGNKTKFLSIFQLEET